MSNPRKTLRQTVLQAVEEQRNKHTEPASRHAQVLAEFIRLQLKKLQMSETQLAQQIDWSENQVQLLLQGTLPLAILTEEMLQRLGQALKCDAGLMQIILDRSDFIQSFSG
jgi:hypothetical protein